MSLFPYRAPVKYAEQKDIFKDFLQHYKSFESADAIEDLRLDEDDDEDEEMEDGTTERRRRDPKVKYMQILQDIADRVKDNIVIELDDLDSVSRHIAAKAVLSNVC
jgi:DNA replication licensing factor MCM7